MSDPRPPLTVVLGTRSTWPEIAATLDALVPQAQECGAEILVVDGAGRAFDRDVPPTVRYVSAPGGDVFRLRAVGWVEARGEIVAFSEDHCVPARDFCAAILRAHEEHPQAAVSGAVVNGSPNRAIDRANFLNVHGGNLPSLVGTTPMWGPTPTNVSFKRSVIPDEEPPTGWLEIVFGHELQTRDEVAIDARIVVSHVQSTGRLGTFANHFHAGRSFAGFARQLAPKGERTGFLLRNAVAVPRPIVRRALRGGRIAEAPRSPHRLLPLIVGLALAGALGVLWGGWTGPGKSALKLR
jgi:glycosyl transferase family 2